MASGHGAERVAALDVLKGAAIVLVVFNHALLWPMREGDLLSAFLYGTAFGTVAAFAAVAGYLRGLRPPSSERMLLARRARQLLLPWAMAVPVYAAAAGVVLATRDGEVDESLRVKGAEAVAGREAGNAVVVDHGDGWVTQYNHLKRGSVAVRRGDRVQAGSLLGMVGLSGRTEFPHLELEVRKDGRPVGPFVGLETATSCGPGPHPLWTPAALAAWRMRSRRILA